MSKLCILVLAAVMLAGVIGCKSTPRGDREYIPGRGWVPTE